MDTTDQGFWTYLVVKESEDDNNKWELVHDLVYRGNDDFFLVRTGFTTDFASVPKIVSWLVPRYGRFTKAAVLHDYLVEDPDGLGISRCDADGLFRKTLKELGVGYVRRRLMWAGVRWAGGVSECGWGELLLVLLITVLALPLVVPLAVVSVSLLVFWLVQAVFYSIRRLLGWASTPPPDPPWSW